MMARKVRRVRLICPCGRTVADIVPTGYENPTVDIIPKGGATHESFDPYSRDNATRGRNHTVTLGCRVCGRSHQLRTETAAGLWADAGGSGSVYL